METAFPGRPFFVAPGRKKEKGGSKNCMEEDRTVSCDMRSGSPPLPKLKIFIFSANFFNRKKAKFQKLCKSAINREKVDCFFG
ncbi:hypothetical protein [Pseudoflavonifractor sp. AF19-9AC]|uniref:hypothetical protein n=1 Tax=Pseudoflavonifractor sp. AF19-9AC TaxID=2292244 RepID=UPI0011C4840D|nr:hypothetical protein [Pseudoflavonifractor sp. AF19-9AC]